MKFSLFIVISLIFLVSCGDDSGSGSTSTNTAVTTSDPYIAQAVFYWDKNNDFFPDSNEPLTSPTDENGRATFSVAIPQGGIIRQKHFGISGGITYPGGLEATIDKNVDPSNVVITPLTTLLSYCPNIFTTPEELLDAIKAASSTYDGLDISDLYSDPMIFRDNTLLIANQSAMNSLWAQVPELRTKCDSEHFNIFDFQGDFKVNTEIFASVLRDFDADNLLAGKMASTFSNFIYKYTNQYLNNPAELEKALLAVETIMGTNTDAFFPVILARSENVTGTYIAQKLDTSDWLPTDDYYVIGSISSNNYKRFIKNYIGNYNSSPRKVELAFRSFKNDVDSGIQVDDLNYDTDNYSATGISDFNSATMTNSIIQTFTNKNNKKPYDKTIVLKNNLPLYTTNSRSEGVFRAFPMEIGPLGDTKSFFPVVGQGIETREYYGINVDKNFPSQKDLWRTDFSRNNNCFEAYLKPGEYNTYYKLNFDCLIGTQKTGDTTYYIKFDALSEKIPVTTYYTFIPISSWQDKGDLPPSTTLILKIKPSTCYSATPTYYSDLPCDSDPQPISTNLVIAKNDFADGEIEILDPDLNGDRFRVNIGSQSRVESGSELEGFTIRAQACMTPSGGWSCYINRLRIHAINKIKIGGIEFDTSKRSGFYRNGILFLDLKGNELSSSPYDIILLNLIARTGFAIKKEGNRSLLVNDVPIFNYDGISDVLIEDIY